MRPLLSLVVAISLVALAPALAAQAGGNEKPPTERDPAERMRDLEERVKGLEEQLETMRKEERASEERRDRRLTVFGDIGLRWHSLTSNGLRNNTAGTSNTINRPEFRVRLGVTGFLMDDDKHRMKYGVRLSTVGLGEYTAPLGEPAESWRPFDPFGSRTAVSLDRYWIQHDYKQWLRAGAGKFGSPFVGTEAVFDNDFGLTGGFLQFDIGRFADLYDARPLEDWRDLEVDDARTVSRLVLSGAAYYLAQNNIGLPTGTADTVPHGHSVQMALKLRIQQTDTSFILAAGMHNFEGEEAVAPNVGTGSTSSTTNALDARGLPFSEFHILDLYAEAVLFEQRLLSLKAHVHVLHNFGADPNSQTGGAEDLGYTLGLAWGALVLEQARDFRIGYSYWHMRPDATLPQFNHDVVNTNFKGHIVVAAFMITDAFSTEASLSIGSRVVPDIGGVGRRADGFPGTPGNDNETRWRLGINLRF